MNIRRFDNVPVMRQADKDAETMIKKLQKFIEDKHHIQFSDYWDFQKWSTDYIDEFWADLWDFAGIISSKKYDEVIDRNATFSDSFEWFKGAKLNYAENLLKYRDDNVALITLGEDKARETLTFAEMYGSTELYAAAFRKSGLKKGDVVVCYMSNREEAIFAMAAVVSIGAIWTGALPLMGSQAALDRFQQVNPKFLITVDRFRHAGFEIEMLPKVKQIAEELHSLEKVIIVPSRGVLALPDVSHIKKSCFVHEFLKLGLNEDGSVPPMQFEQVPLSHPIFIIFTSGTTGLPKPLVHSSGAILAVIREFHIHFNSKRGSNYLSATSVGWISWNLLSSLLFLGMTVTLFEGEPHYLTPTYFWDMVDENKITHLLLLTSIIDEWQKRRCLPTEKHSLESLKCIVTGGCVVKPQIYDFVYEKLKKDILFSSAYGCTEAMGASLLTESSVPIHRGEIPVPGLGNSVKVLNENGQSIVGEVGEMVYTKPMPGLCQAIWGDLDGSLYKEKYLSKYPGKFTLGDFAIINPVTKGWIICGRSDDTLKQRGCRFGSSEIYNVVDLIPAVRDSLCVSKYNKDMDESAVLFLKMRDGYSFNSELVQQIRAAITKELTVHHIPDFILPIKDIPFNVNGKKMEMLVKNIINNKPYNVACVSNPETLKYYHNIPELQNV